MSVDGHVRDAGLLQTGRETRRVEGVHRVPEVRVTARAAADRRSLNSEILHLIEVALTTSRAGEAGSPGGDPASPALLRGKPDSSPA
ncbi:hypothetical protein ACFYO2_27515 [Streptomyces sp. NPDC006602]|uniref:hypothetical protein n=1 Tax=Streptomyces sp. NPDC006602 TaxID=3364751 RepID=UPI0036B25CFD